MFSFMNTVRTMLAKFVSFIYSALCVASTGVSAPSEMPKTPEDFTPTLRFMVCSDIHINGKEGQKEPLRFVDAVNTAYAYAQEQSYSSLDAVCVAGDFTDEGTREQYDIFKECVAEAVKEPTELVVCAGNHEYIEWRENHEGGSAVAVPVFEEMLSRKTDNHIVINGYHFISVSPDDNGERFYTKKKWLRAELDKAVADTGDKPVFVFQHPAPTATIYGSIHWGDISVSQVLNKYPQVIDFSGHSHYPINDPRSIWQGTFTALGSGTLSYFETELDYIAGNRPYDCENAAQFYIVEADKDGNVRILCYDLITHQFFDREYYLTNLADRNYEYTYNKMKARDSVPVFADDVKIGVSVNESGETVLEFEGAKSSFVVESYKVSVAKNGIIKVADDNFSGKYMYLYMDDIYQVNLGKLESGKSYTAQIVALNAYSQTSKPLTYTFTAP